MKKRFICLRPVDIPFHAGRPQNPHANPDQPKSDCRQKTQETHKLALVLFFCDFSRQSKAAFSRRAALRLEALRSEEGPERA
jgi:hypothetical protein